MKRGAEKGLAMLKGGTTSCGVVFTLELEILAILKGGFPLFKRGGGAQKVLPCLEVGEAQQILDPRFSHFVAPPPRY